MECTHNRIMSRNCVLYCMECGAELPADYLTGKHKTEPAKAAETPENGGKTAQAEKMDTAKRTTRKKAK